MLRASHFGAVLASALSMASLSGCLMLADPQYQGSEGGGAGDLKLTERSSAPLNGDPFMLRAHSGLVLVASRGALTLFDAEDPDQIELSASVASRTLKSIHLERDTAYVLGGGWIGSDRVVTELRRFPVDRSDLEGFGDEATSEVIEIGEDAGSMYAYGKKLLVVGASSLFVINTMPLAIEHAVPIDIETFDAGVVANDHFYIAYRDATPARLSRMAVFKLSEGQAPELLTDIRLGEPVEGMTVVDDTLFVVPDTGFDDEKAELLSFPLKPANLAGAATPHQLSDQVGPFVYDAESQIGYASSLGSLDILDFSDKATPKLLGSAQLSASRLAIDAEDGIDQLYNVHTGSYSGTLTVLDLYER